jgi:DNA gyrase subunit B
MRRRDDVQEERMTMNDAAPEHPAAADAYVCGSIVVLEGLEPVRRRPGMYIGDPRDGTGLHHIVQEVVDNAVNQHLDDRCFQLSVTIHAGGALTVEDDGPGIPVETVSIGEERLPALEIVLTRLAAYRRGAVEAHRGYRLYGVGLASVNAVCEQMVVEVRRDGRLHRFSCRKGRPDGPLAVLGATDATGTRITLHPDPSIFGDTTFSARRLLDMLRPFAFLHPGLHIELVDERRGGRRETLHGRGIAAWVALLGEGRDGFPADPLRLRAARNDITMDMALRWTREPRSHVRVFANDRDACTGVLHRAIAKAVKDVARRNGVVWKLRDWDPKRLLRGLAAVVDLRGPNIEAVGYCRNVLDTDEACLLRDVLAEKLAEVLERRPALFEELVNLAVG